jgi:hypothetical protein
MLLVNRDTFTALHTCFSLSLTFFKLCITQTGPLLGEIDLVVAEIAKVILELAVL